MDKSHKFARRRRLAGSVAVLALILALASGVHVVRAQSTASSPSSDDDLIAQFRRVEVASVSDAIEQIVGKRMYMSHHMQPIFTAKSLVSREPSNSRKMKGARIPRR